jgi:hypothetical protein
LKEKRDKSFGYVKGRGTGSAKALRPCLWKAKKTSVLGPEYKWTR